MPVSATLASGFVCLHLCDEILMDKQDKQKEFRRNLTIFGLVSGLTIVSLFAGLSEIRRHDAEMLQSSTNST